MDPQKLSQLDPKLREAYQRVMKTSVSQQQAPSMQSQTPPPPAKSDLAPPTFDVAPAASDAASSNEPVSSIPDPTPQVPLSEPTHPPFDSSEFKSPYLAQPQPFAESPTPVTEPQIISANTSRPQEPLQQNSFDRMHSQVASTPQVKEIPMKKKKPFMPLLIGVVVLILILAYTFFWTTVFNFKLPFLP